METADRAAVMDSLMLATRAREAGCEAHCLPNDLVVAAGAMDGPLLVPLWSRLRSDRFQAQVTELGGYSTKEMGCRIR